MNASAAVAAVRVIRVFVSSPGDVAAERAVLDEVVARINRTDGLPRGVRLELFKWEQDIVPQIGPRPQEVVDAQTLPYDVYLGILSTRFGTPAGRYGSGTEKEFKDALKKWTAAGAPWILFYFDAAPKLTGDPDQAEQYVKVCKFRRSLDKQERGLYDTYTGVRDTPDSLFLKADEHLRKIVQRLVPLSAEPPLQQPDPDGYLGDLLEDTAHIDIRGLSVGTGQAHRFPIEQLFISLTTNRAPGEARRRTDSGRPEPDEMERAEGPAAAASVPLHEALQHDRLIVVGDPGSGKTTFVNRVAQSLCQTQLGIAPHAARQQLGLADRTFPVLVKLSDLAQHLARTEYPIPAPGNATAAVWLPHYLATASAEQEWNLTFDFFCQQLKAGACTVLLDGLDEAPERVSRQRLSKIIENAARTYGPCRFVVTSRPSGYTSEVSLPGFEHATINPLSDEAVETFLIRWCEALYAGNREAARRHLDELLGSVQARTEIRRMARNPVMLTALAVVHWNERRLPEQRAYLYDSIITWLSRSREQRPGRATAEQTVVLLQELALAMQAPSGKPEAPARESDSAGRLTRVSKRWAAEQIAAKVMEIAGKPAAVTAEAIAHAERFLDDEEVDSGIIVARGKEVTFWHLTFQEFLAAKAITSRLDEQQRDILFAAPERIYQAEWREVILLLSGILHEQGRAKVDGFMAAILAAVRPDADLAAQARCAGLVASLLRDLGPLKYQVSDPRYQRLLTASMAIFDRQGSTRVPLETRIAAADALGQAGDPRIDFRRDDYWVTIPASRFLMGAQSKDPKQPNYDKEANDEREFPVHEVTLDAFRIARYPVTVGQFQHFVEDDGYQTRRWWQAGGFGQTKEPDNWADQLRYPSRPVVSVCWFEAAAFCDWAGFRLPTEAQWERAARGTEGRKFPWSNEPADGNRLNCYDWPVGHPTPVGIYPLGMTPEGICDVAGNVWEWCQDWYGEYPVEAVSNPTGSSQAGLRVFRGGGWGTLPGSAARRPGRGAEPRVRYDSLGLRLAAVPQAKSSFFSSPSPSPAEPGAEAETAQGR